MTPLFFDARSRGPLSRSSWQTSGDQVKGMNSVVQGRKETELIAAIVAGDIHLYDQLIRPYERSVYSVSFSFMKNEEDAADVAQETFIKAFRNLSWHLQTTTAGQCVHFPHGPLAPFTGQRQP
jgi:hypothetical protein